ncbi:uncharacterized protein [Palaemon carinicauda]|uniref:uncharacterized protein n=1 Tax=Palaemon carinicauda TaxID=392227 RepID=UPI0035B5F72F
MGKSWMLLCLILFSTGLEAKMRSKRFAEKIITTDSPECEFSGVVMTCDFKGQKEGKSWMLLCLILFSTGLEAKMRSKRFKENIITEDSPECKISGEVMDCDYKGQNEKPLYIKPLHNPQIQMVYLSNIRYLYLDECVSVHLSVTNVKRVSIKFSSGNSNCPKFKLSAKYSNLDGIPNAVSQLYLEECNVEMIQPKLSLSEFQVIASKVQQLDVAMSLVNGTVAILQSSRIAHLKHFTVDSGSTLLIKETTIESMPLNAIDLRNGKVVVENSIINRVGISKEGVLVGGVTYHVEGTLSMTPFSKYEVFETLEQASYFNLFCVFLVLFLVSSIAFCAYVIGREWSLRKLKQELNSGRENYSTVPREEETGCDCEINSATKIELKRIVDESKKEFEIIQSSFEPEKPPPVNEMDECDKKNETKLREYTNYLYKYKAIEDFYVTFLGRIIETKRQTNSGKRESLPTAEKTQYKDIKDTFVNCESQAIQTLSYLQGPAAKKKGSLDRSSKSIDDTSHLNKPQRLNSKSVDDPSLLNVPEHLEKSYKEFWKSIKSGGKFCEILKYTQDEVEDAILSCGISTLKILVSIEESHISDMMKCISTD